MIGDVPPKTFPPDDPARTLGRTLDACSILKQA
jgi:hypothetical protein